MQFVKACDLYVGPFEFVGRGQNSVIPSLILPVNKIKKSKNNLRSSTDCSLCWFYSIFNFWCLSKYFL